MQIQVAYESEDPNVHSMDVEQLAPSLLAIGRLCKRANAIVNGDGATVRVLVESDFEHKCFLINFQVVQDIYSQVQSILQHHDVRTSKEILEWLGLIEMSMGGFGLFKYLKEKRGRSVQSIETSDAEGSVKILLEGSNNYITVNQHVYKFSQDQTLIDAAKTVLQPTQFPGITAVEFKDKGRTIDSVGKEEAAEIIANEHPEIPVDPARLPPQVVEARITIYSPVFDPDPDAPLWRFRYGEQIIRVDVTHTGIIEDVLRRGGVRIGDSYIVDLEIAEHRTEKGRYTHSHRVLKLKQFIPAPLQMSLLPPTNGAPRDG